MISSGDPGPGLVKNVARKTRVPSSKGGQSHSCKSSYEIKKNKNKVESTVGNPEIRLRRQQPLEVPRKPCSIGTLLPNQEWENVYVESKYKVNSTTTRRTETQPSNKRLLFYNLCCLREVDLHLLYGKVGREYREVYRYFCFRGFQWILNPGHFCRSFPILHKMNKRR